MEATEQVSGQQAVQSKSPVLPQMTVGNWIVTFILLIIPFVNIILLFMWAFDPTSGRRNFARAYLIIAGIMIVLWIVLVIIMIILGSATGLFSNFNFS